MKIRYLEQKNTPGHGSLRCEGSDAAQGDVTFALQRGSDQCYLSSQGTWLQEQTFLAATARREGDALLLDIGPSVVNLLDTQETYRFFLHTGGALEKAVLRIPSVNYGPAASTDNLPPLPSPTAQETLPDETPTPSGEPASREEGGEEPPAQVEEAPPASLPDPEPSPPPPAQKTRLSAALLTAATLLLLCVAGGLLWYVLSRPDQPATPSETQETEAPAPLTAAGAPAPTAELPTAALPVDQQVTLFFQGQNRTPAAAAELSRTLPRATRAEQEAIYRLYYFAGENGETSVLMDYAACLDPSRPDWGGINKDPAAAWGIYEKARAAGIEDAAEAQHAMRQWLRAREADGNAQAAYWLRQLP